MPNCPECGIQYQDHDESCTGCGMVFKNTAQRPEEIIHHVAEETNWKSVHSQSIAFGIDQGDLDGPLDQISSYSEAPLAGELAMGDNNNPTDNPQTKFNFAESETIMVNLDRTEEAPTDESGIKKDSAPADETADFTPYSGFGNMRLQNDSHLGKGIIKPNRIERDSDGYHFKYEEPSYSHVVKSGTVKDKVTELRVTNPEPNAAMFAEQEPYISPPFGEEGFDLETDNIETQTIATEFNDKPQENITTPDLTTPPGDYSFIPDSKPAAAMQDNMTDLITEFTDHEVVNLPEPELTVVKPKPSFECELLWQGNQTWNGWPLKNKYRITSQSIGWETLQNGHSTEIEWNYIHGVKLRQTWVGRVLNVGDLIVYSCKHPIAEFTLAGIRQPLKIKKLIEELID